jgi:hypothetical protein
MGHVSGSAAGTQQPSVMKANALRFVVAAAALSAFAATFNPAVIHHFVGVLASLQALVK